jgi:hypothetical protein
MLTPPGTGRGQRYPLSIAIDVCQLYIIKYLGRVAVEKRFSSSVFALKFILIYPCLHKIVTMFDIMRDGFYPLTRQVGA